jgi:hypothetical protein
VESKRILWLAQIVFFNFCVDGGLDTGKNGHNDGVTGGQIVAVKLFSACGNRSWAGRVRRSSAARVQEARTSVDENI